MAEPTGGEAVVPLVAAGVAAVFAGVVIARYAERRRSADATWGLGLAMYAAASLAEAWGGAFGWSDPVYRAYYALAPGLVGFLGLGTLFLLRDTRPALAFAGLALAVFAFLAIAAAVAPVDAAVLATADPGLRAIGGAPRVAAVALNLAGGTLLVGGAFASWWQSRATGVLLIALGAILPFAGGSLASLGVATARAWAQLLGIVVMFVGFLLARSAQAPRLLPQEAATR